MHNSMIHDINDHISSNKIFMHSQMCKWPLLSSSFILIVFPLYSVYVPKTFRLLNLRQKNKKKKKESSKDLFTGKLVICTISFWLEIE